MGRTLQVSHGVERKRPFAPLTARMWRPPHLLRSIRAPGMGVARIGNDSPQRGGDGLGAQIAARTRFSRVIPPG